jgi:hypothetical protein
MLRSRAAQISFYAACASLTALRGVSKHEGHGRRAWPIDARFAADLG